MKVKAEDISYALNFLDDDIIAECDRMRESDKTVPVKKKARISTIIPIAAAACLLFVAGGILLKVNGGLSDSSAKYADLAPAAADTEHSSEVQEITDQALAGEERLEDENGENLTYGLQIDSYLGGEDLVDAVDGEPAEVAGNVISISALDEQTREVISSLAEREAYDIKIDHADSGFAVISNAGYTDYGLFRGEDGSCYAVVSSENTEYTVRITSDEYEMLSGLAEEFGSGLVILDE